MTWYLWMESGRPHLGHGNSLQEAKQNHTNVTHARDCMGKQFSPADETWLKSEIEKLEQERRNLKIPPEPLF